MLRFLAPVASVLLFVSSLTAAEPKVAQRWALLIGVDEYAFKQPRKFCGTDQQALRDRLVAADFPADHVFLLHDKATEAKLKPTKENIARQLDEVLKSAAAEDVVVVAFSGHGVSVDGQSYMCPGGCSVDDVATLISVDKLYKRLVSTTAKVKLFVNDAGRTDPRPEGKRPKEAAAADSTEEPKMVGATMILNSCCPGEESRDDEKLGRSVFMHYLLDGLGGAADKNADGILSLDELQNHIGRSTMKHAYMLGFTQRPFYKGDLLPEDEKLPLVTVKKKP